MCAFNFRKSFAALLLLLPLYSLAQFPTAVGTKWEYVQFWDDLFVPQALRNAFEDVVVGDTVAGGNTYQVVRRTGSMYHASQFPYYYDPLDGTYYYRVAGSQVLVLDTVQAGVAHESILYDFGLVAGDSLPYPPQNIIGLTPGGNAALLLSYYNFDTACGQFGMCDSNVVLETYPGSPPLFVPGLRWAPHQNFVYLPDIGIVFSTPYLAVLDVLGQYYFLLRLTSNGQVLFENPGLITGVDPGPPAGQLQVFPNPSDGPVQVHCGSSIQSAQLVQLTGRVVANVSVSGSDVGLDFGDVPSGIYLLRLNTDTGSLTRKLVLR